MDDNTNNSGGAEFNIRNPFLENRNEMINNGNTENLSLDDNNGNSFMIEKGFSNVNDDSSPLDSQTTSDSINNFLSGNIC